MCGNATDRTPGPGIRYGIRDSPLGRLLLAVSGQGVCQVCFGDDDLQLERTLRVEFPFAPLERDEVATAGCLDLLIDYLEGRSSRVELPLDVAGSLFQRRVWDALRRIPRGETLSYSEVAARIGVPLAARAVARACASNPVPVLIPCHRVIAKDGSLGGYAQGVSRKRMLLALESRPTSVSGASSARAARDYSITDSLSFR
jgi:AraC family transcriptional regulator of adaptative response/methylated-DNA-[protein]-cysteine methyltransferase